MKSSDGTTTTKSSKNTLNTVGKILLKLQKFKPFWQYNNLRISLKHEWVNPQKQKYEELDALQHWISERKQSFNDIVITTEPKYVTRFIFFARAIAINNTALIKYVLNYCSISSSKLCLILFQFQQWCQFHQVCQWAQRSSQHHPPYRRWALTAFHTPLSLLRCRQSTIISTSNRPQWTLILTIRQLASNRAFRVF